VPIPDLLRDLLTAAGPSGHEEPASRVWREAASAFAEVHGDTLGTSFARVGRNGAATLAIVGHIDEIGLTVTHIGSDGLLAYATLGVFDAEIGVGQRVVLAGNRGPVEGVLASREVSRRDRSERSSLRHSDLHVDIGAASAEEAAGLVSPGDPGVWKGEPIELQNDRIVSKALDNRLGAYIALEATRRIGETARTDLDVVAVASVQEELGHQGARTAAYSLDPTVAIALDVTWATDVPGANPRRAGQVDLGSGAAITRGPTINPHVSDLLARAAAEEEILHTFEVYAGRTQTDADDLSTARGGIPTGLVSVPVRYMHTPSELASLGDVEAAIRLVVAFAARLTRDTSFLR
jgi:endoglucanase